MAHFYRKSTPPRSDSGSGTPRSAASRHGRAADRGVGLRRASRAWPCSHWPPPFPFPLISSNHFPRLIQTVLAQFCDCESDFVLSICMMCTAPAGSISFLFFFFFVQEERCPLPVYNLRRRPCAYRTEREETMTNRARHFFVKAVLSNYHKPALFFLFPTHNQNHPNRPRRPIKHRRGGKDTLALFNSTLTVGNSPV